MNTKDSYFMKEALEEAKKARIIGEIPVGAVCVYKDRIIARAHNLKEKARNPLYHAEILVINKVARVFKRWRLTDISLYVTLEPCYMCAGAIVFSRIKRVIFGAFDSKIGVYRGGTEIFKDNRLNHEVEVKAGVLKNECSSVLRDFFKKRRDA